MRIATWNVNSIRARQERLFSWLLAQQPDVVCLQEIKVSKESFPFAELRELGYHAVVCGQKTYNGVAILTRTEPADTECGINDGVEDLQARLIAATVEGIRVISAYVPNGAKMGTNKYAYKLEWMRRLKAYLQHGHTRSDPLVLCGDLNVAPEERDVANPGAWEGSVLFNPEVWALLCEILDQGLIDTFRLHHSESGHYSWWDYRLLAFPRNDGLRIDHIFATPPLAERCISAFIDRDQRQGPKPSDHAPVMADFNWP